MALIWKNSNMSNAEVVNYDSVTKKTNQKKKGNDNLKEVTIDRKQVSPEQQTIEEAKKKAETQMNIALFYPTAEKLYEGIKEAQEKGNDKRADELIAFLLEQYPDFEMPDE